MIVSSNGKVAKIKIIFYHQLSHKMNINFPSRKPTHLVLPSFILPLYVPPFHSHSVNEHKKYDPIKQFFNYNLLPLLSFIRRDCSCPRMYPHKYKWLNFNFRIIDPLTKYIY